MTLFLILCLQYLKNTRVLEQTKRKPRRCPAKPAGNDWWERVFLWARHRLPVRSDFSSLSPTLADRGPTRPYKMFLALVTYPTMVLNATFIIHLNPRFPLFKSQTPRRYSRDNMGWRLFRQWWAAGMVGQIPATGAVTQLGFLLLVLPQSHRPKDI